MGNVLQYLATHIFDLALIYPFLVYFLLPPVTRSANMDPDLHIGVVGTVLYE